ncbi:DUF6624 domain-containing protein [Spongiimicrobium salis]|uniref:DUF6624 domain-containing protein n=1 Tax=Spongiimicrobium salis TaxID=1667022 RepID=UPI00374D3DAE
MKFVKLILNIVPTLLLIVGCKAQEPNCEVQELNTKLIKMMKEEQDVRKALMPLIAQNQKDGSGGLELFALATKMGQIDEKNQKELNAIFEHCGWPENLMPKAHQGVFLILQHSPDSLMRKHYPRVKKYAEMGLLMPDDAATMYDRLQMYARKPQRYGTQTFQRNSQNVVWPIQNMDSLSSLRSSVGLPSMEAYFKIAKDSTTIEIVWDKKLKIEDIPRNE